MSANESLSTGDPQEVVVLPADAADAAALHNLLADLPATFRFTEDETDLLRGIAADTGAALLAEAALSTGLLERLTAALRAQPAWSDFPLLILTDKRTDEPRSFGPAEQLAEVANVFPLERPPQRRLIRAAVRAALRGRARQFGLRAALQDRAAAEADTRTTGATLDERTELNQLLRDVATAANSAESVGELLTYVLRRVSKHNGWCFGHAFVRDPKDADALVLADSYYELHPGRFEAFRRATETAPLRRGVGLPGRVLASAAAEWTASIADDLLLRRVDAASVAGVQSALAFPILTGSDVTAVLEFFSDEPHEPDELALDLMLSIGTQIGLVVARERAQKSLEESHRLVSKISDTAPMMLHIYDLRERRYTYANKRMLAFFDLRTAEVMQAGSDVFARAIHREDAGVFDNVVEQLEHRGAARPVTWSARFLHAHDGWRYLRTWSVRFREDDAGHLEQVLGATIDVTDLVEAETRLRQTDRLASLGTLAAGIAHEVNNPLASVIMNGQLLLREDQSERSRTLIEHLIADAKRCGRIVRSVQQFARQEPTERTFLQLNDVATAAVRLSATAARRAGVTVHLELADALPAVHADRTELEQVALNLISNALNAMPDGGTLTLRTQHTPESIVFSVVDTGPGMTPDVRARALDPFFTTRGSEGGTGLGLSIVHGIVEDMQGRLSLGEAPGGGTVVEISLPLRRPTDNDEAHT